MRRRLALFLDYDGTLTPIVPRPDEARLSHSMRTTLRRLCGLCAVGIVSGRDLADIRERVGIEGLWYAGSHGFDIAGPEGAQMEHQEGTECLPTLDAAEQTLRTKLAAVPGCLVERKRFSVATHHRQVADADLANVKRIVEQTRDACPGLRLATGNRIFELQPDIDWDKGKALRWLMQALNLRPADSITIYIGDDVTDEDAFRELAAEGAGILVAQEPRSSRAICRLADPDAVEQFLNRLGDALQRSPC